MMNAIHNHQLPDSKYLNINALSRLFYQTTNSYKHLFFLALQSLLWENRFSSTGPIQLRSIQNKMLAIAWYPHTFFKLSFGVQDKVASLLETMMTPILTARVGTITHVWELTEHIDRAVGDELLLRYVPNRLLRPFFTEELRGLADHLIDGEIRRLTRIYFSTHKPLYQFSDDDECIFLHEEWLDYLRNNYTVIQGWALWEWLHYMQARNPNVPNIAAKLLPPLQRGSLTPQREFWNLAIKNWPEKSPFACPYTGITLKPSQFVLDHFLPWAFVAHDRLWNLIPSHPEANAAKSDRIPTPNYLEGLAHRHHTALLITREKTTKKSWASQVESYMVDLQLDHESLLDERAMRHAYKTRLEPLMALAEAHGFESGWRWS